MERFEPGSGWRPLRQIGSADEMRRGIDYDVEATLVGVALSLKVNRAHVADVHLPQPLAGWQCGFTAWGVGSVEFRNFRAEPEMPHAFVVMKFGEPYDSIYREVIQPVTTAAGYEVVRADEFSGPGIIVEDIVRAIREADVVIAEMTPVNANVFYELGYAHALGKPTVLLAERGQALPFDVSGWRAIFYDNTIGGRRQVEEQLGRHLANISA